MMINPRLYWFKTMAILLPVIILIMIEGMLRLFGYGYDTRLFIPSEDNKKMLVMNRDVSKKYFTVGENATIGNHDEFFGQKKREILRFFVLGASSSIGYPYGHNGSFPRMLKYRLQFDYPNNTIEIINLSLTAINSYTLADFARQVADQQPDGVLIYAGHNEYYGALGIASTNRLGGNPIIIRTMLHAKNLKLVQWLTNVAASIRKPNQQLADPNLTLMQRMAAGKEVNYQSPQFLEGIKQFDRNMQYLLRIFQEKQIPVFIGTLVSNLGGQKPLGEDKTAHAEFTAGEEARLQGDIESARKHFILAKEYDNLRFRAPEAMNEKIREYATAFSNVRVVEVQNIFEASSPDGIIGRELILEHVHPNLEGYRLMADAFYFSMKEILPASDAEIRPVISRNDYPFTSFDTIYGDLSVRILKSLWPFNEKMETLLPNTMESRLAAAYIEKKINWNDAMKRLYEGYLRENNNTHALRVLEGMCLELPHNAIFISQTAKLCLKLEEFEKAYYYLLKEYELSPQKQDIRQLKNNIQQFIDNKSNHQ
jgi:lysophospholipase L1-like esterase